MRVIAVVALLGLAACQQTIRVETRFLPPTDPEQLACVEGCNRADRDCLSMTSEPQPLGATQQTSQEVLIEDERARREYDECSKRVESEYEACQMSARPSGTRNNCYKPVCLVKGTLAVAQDSANASHAQKDKAACARIFEACYRRCGGRIETHQVCEGDC